MVEEILNTINGIDDEEIQRVVEGMNEEVNCQYNNCNTNMHNAIYRTKMRRKKQSLYCIVQKGFMRYMYNERL